MSLSVGFSINKGGMKTKDKKNKFIELIVQGNDLTINLSFLKKFFVLSNKIYSTVTDLAKFLGWSKSVPLRHATS